MGRDGSSRTLPRVTLMSAATALNRLLRYDLAENFLTLLLDS